MKKDLFKRVFSLTVGLLIIYFLFNHVWKYWDIAKKITISINWGMLALSYVFGVCSFFVYSVAWYFIIRNEEPAITFKEANYLLTKGNFGKYIPGRVWQFFSRLYLFNNKGYSKTKILMFALLEQYFLLVTAFIIFGSAYFFWQNLIEDAFIKDIKIFVIAALVISFVSLHPIIISSWFNLVSKVNKKYSVKLTINITFVIVLTIIYVAYWLLIGLSVLFLIKGGVKIQAKYIFFVIGSNAIAYIIGYVSLITPGGLGVREAVLAYFLESILTKGLGALFSILSRLMLIMEEVGYFLCSLIFYKYVDRCIIQFQTNFQYSLPVISALRKKHNK